jgi:hypothetical protein
MIIKDIYSFKGGLEYLEENHKDELKDIYDAVESMNIYNIFSKLSKERNKPPIIFSPRVMNKELGDFLFRNGWLKENKKNKKGYEEPKIYFADREFRAMDGIKNKVGLEIQIGKYSFMAYDIFCKMPIFHKKGLIECGIELVMSKKMLKDVSSGIGSFDQIVMDIKARGESDIDIPVVILGFECTEDDWNLVNQIREKGVSEGTGLKGNIPGPK